MRLWKITLVGFGSRDVPYYESTQERIKIACFLENIYQHALKETLTVMFEDFGSSARQPQSEDETGVVLLVTKNEAAGTEKSRNVEGVGGKPHAEHNGILHP